MMNGSDIYCPKKHYIYPLHVPSTVYRYNMTYDKKEVNSNSNNFQQQQQHSCWKIKLPDQWKTHQWGIIGPFSRIALCKQQTEVFILLYMQ